MAHDIVPLQDAPDALVQGASTHMLSLTQLLVHEHSPAVGSPALEATMIVAGEGVGQDVRKVPQAGIFSKRPS
jgi:hypothetical protein